MGWLKWIFLTMGIAQPFCASEIHFLVFGSDFLGVKKREGQAAAISLEPVISNLLAVFGAPDILVAGKDKKIRWVEFTQDFCTSHNITLQTAIPGHHQSLGATERTHAQFEVS